MTKTFADVLRGQLQTDINNYTADLASGVCKSFDEYQKLCGVIRGLAIAQEYVTDLAKKVEEHDE